MAKVYRDMFVFDWAKNNYKKSKNHKNFTNFCKIRNLTKKFHPHEVYNDTYGPTLSNLKIRSMV